MYGTKNLKTLNRELSKIAKKNKYTTEFYQSNIEGNIVTKIQKSSKNIAGLLINPAAYTHSSIAIRDALLAIQLPAVEVHCSNIYKREPFRQQSLISDVVDGQVIGFGSASYKLGLNALIERLEHQ